jgi:hypothetical protein
MSVEPTAQPSGIITPPQERTPGLGIAAFFIGICGFPLWIALGAAIGHQLTDLGGANRTLVLALGGCVFILLGINALAIVMGFIAAFRKNCPKTLSILGIALNAIQLLLMLLVVALGHMSP